MDNKKTVFCLTLLVISTLLGERHSSMFMFHLSHRSDTGDLADLVKITKWSPWDQVWERGCGFLLCLQVWLGQVWTSHHLLQDTRPEHQHLHPAHQHPHRSLHGLCLWDICSKLQFLYIRRGRGWVQWCFPLQKPNYCEGDPDPFRNCRHWRGQSNGKSLSNQRKKSLPPAECQWNSQSWLQWLSQDLATQFLRGLTQKINLNTGS